MNPLRRLPLGAILNLYIEGKLAGTQESLAGSHCKLNCSGGEREAESVSAEGLRKNEMWPPSVCAQKQVLRHLRIKWLRQKWEGNIWSGKSCWYMVESQDFLN